MKRFEAFLNTPPLWTGTAFGLKQFELPKIDLSSFVPQYIPENLRLGHQVEYIFEQLLTHSGAYEVLLHNLQIQRDKITIGELDFILKPQIKKNNYTTPSKLIHLELTYKFYLIDPSIPETINQLVGPNRGDAFHSKLQKTKSKQLPLLFTEEANRILRDKDIDVKNIDQQCCFLGQVFLPYYTTSFSHEIINTNCVKGYWMRLSDFEMKSFDQLKFYMPSKQAWLLTPYTNVNWISYREMLLILKSHILNKRSPMIWIRESATQIDKCFVVWWPK